METLDTRVKSARNELKSVYFEGYFLGFSCTYTLLGREPEEVRLDSLSTKGCGVDYQESLTRCLEHVPRLDVDLISGEKLVDKVTGDVLSSCVTLTDVREIETVLRCVLPFVDAEWEVKVPVGVCFILGETDGGVKVNLEGKEEIVSHESLSQLKKQGYKVKDGSYNGGGKAKEAYVNKLYSYLNDEQLDVLKRYYLEFSQVEFNNHNSGKLKIASRKKKELDQLKGAEGNWVYGGFIDTGRVCGGKCTLGHALRYVHIAWDTRQRDLESLYFMKLDAEGLEKLLSQPYVLAFGEKCMGDFFEVDKECIGAVKKAQIESLKDMEKLTYLYESGLYSESLGAFKVAEEVLEGVDKQVALAQLGIGGAEWKDPYLQVLLSHFNAFKKARLIYSETLLRRLQSVLLKIPYTMSLRTTLPEPSLQDLKWVAKGVLGNLPKELDVMEQEGRRLFMGRLYGWVGKGFVKENTPYSWFYRVLWGWLNWSFLGIYKQIPASKTHLNPVFKLTKDLEVYRSMLKAENGGFALLSEYKVPLKVQNSRDGGTSTKAVGMYIWMLSTFKWLTDKTSLFSVEGVRMQLDYIAILAKLSPYKNQDSVFLLNYVYDFDNRVRTVSLWSYRGGNPKIKQLQWLNPLLEVIKELKYYSNMKLKVEEGEVIDFGARIALLENLVKELDELWQELKPRVEAHNKEVHALVTLTKEKQARLKRQEAERKEALKVKKQREQTKSLQQLRVNAEGELKIEALLSSDDLTLKQAKEGLLRQFHSLPITTEIYQKVKGANKFASEVMWTVNRKGKISDKQLPYVAKAYDILTDNQWHLEKRVKQLLNSVGNDKK